MYKRRRSKRKSTSIENAVAKWLTTNKIRYRREFLIGYFHVDFYIKSANLIIQTDGCYWHFNECSCNTNKRPTGDQMAQRLRDKSCNGVLNSLGYNVLRLKECDILKNWEECEKKINSYLKR